MFVFLDKNLHYIYTLIALTLGVSMAFLTPPTAVPDETAHMAKIGAVSAGALVGIPLDERIPAIGLGYRNIYDKVVARDPLITSKDIRAIFNRPLECSRETSNFLRYILGYSPLPYLFSALNYRFLCALDASFGSFLYSSRLINLFISVLLISIGIRFAGMGRWSLVVVGLMPMTLYLLPSISADSLTIGAVICYIGAISGVVSRGCVLAGIRLFILVLAAFLVGLSKPGMAWVLALVLVCYPVYKKARKSFMPILLMAGLLPFLIHLYCLRMGVGYSGINTAEGANPAVNLKIVLESPTRFLGILSNTYFHEHRHDIFISLIGNLGFLDVPPTKLVVGSIITALFFSILLNTRDEQGVWNIGSRLYSVALAICSVMLLAIPLYVTWTAAGANVIEGLQGRYFIPAATLLLVSTGLFIPRWLQDVLAPLTLLLVVLGVIVSMHSLYLRYYYDGPPEAAELSWEWVPVEATGTLAPLWLAQGKTVSGEFAWKHAARIKDIGVLIGTGDNVSDGLLHLQLCNGSECTDAQSSITGSRDNSYLHFRLVRPLVASANSILRYKFRLSGGSHPVAFWTKDVLTSTSGLDVGVAKSPKVSSPLFIVKFQPDDVDSATLSCLFNWAESFYPELFSPAGALTQFSSPYTYRYYQNTNVYVGISSSNNHVYYLGPNGLLQDEGDLSGWFTKAGCK